MMSGLAKELTAYRQMLETKGFERLVLNPSKQIIVQPLQNFVDSKVQQLSTSLRDVPLLKMDPTVIGEMHQSVLDLNFAMKSHAAGMESLAVSLRLFSRALRISSLLFFSGTFLWFGYWIIWTWYYYRQQRRKKSRLDNQPTPEATSHSC
eukprot:TRINITY_DN8702_c0_g1_i1.p1 TRINITY_DN8702_c0_g1~~TRINITY_DN8702_c0_g1_i1.p1  ORF type:complete len:150 (-),score=10.37 TRINITY_DN8702_c0_g1_i1:50-499(-)